MVVSYEVAKLAREKSFTEYCDAYYDYLSNNLCFDLEFPSNNKFDKNIAAPEHHELTEWLRKEHRIFIRLVRLSKDKGDYPVKNNKPCYWKYYIMRMEDDKWVMKGYKTFDHYTNTSGMNEAFEYALKKIKDDQNSN